MTADQKKPKSFARALQYNLAKVGNGVAEVLDHSFSEVSAKLIIREVQMMKTKRPDLEKFFYHTSINFPPHENLSNKLMKQIANDYLQQNGFTQHQFIVFRHYDAGHPHLHIIVNRIGFDEKVLSDSNDYARSEKVLRALEIKYKLTQVNSSKQSKRAVTKNELEMMKRTNEPSGKLKMQQLIKEVLSSKQKLTSSEFIQALQKKGVDVRFNQASTGYVSGISYSYKGMTITGSKLGSDFKWTTIKEIIDYRQGRDRDVILQGNKKDNLLSHDMILKSSNSFKDEGSPIIQGFVHVHNTHHELENSKTAIGHIWDELTYSHNVSEMSVERTLSVKKRKKKKRRSL